MKAPNFITQDRHGGYQFRRKIPANLRPHFSNKREIRRSLRTHHRGTAIQLARRLAAQTDLLFGEVAQVADKKQTRSNKSFDDLYTITLDLNEFGNPRMAVTAEPEETEDAIKAAVEIAKATGLHSPSKPSTPAPDSPAKPAHAALRLKDLSEQWISSKINEGKLKERSEKAYREALDKLFDIVGENITLGEFDDVKANYYADNLERFPVNRWKVGGRDTMTLDEVRDIETKRITPSTASTEISYIRSLFSWLLEKRKLITRNPIKGIGPDIDKDELSRDPFTPEEAQAAFNHPWFRGEKAPRQRGALWAWKYWLPVLGACTGARIEELSRLRKKDIREQRGIMAFEFMPAELTPEMTARRKKTAGKSTAATRLVPVHAVLVELGFMDFVESRPEGYLFDGMTETNHRRSHSASGRLSNVFKESGTDKSMHNLRHMMRDLLSESGADWATTLALMGHAPSGESARYGTRLKQNIKAIAPGFERVDLQNIFAHVKPWSEIKHLYKGGAPD